MKKKLKKQIIYNIQIIFMSVAIVMIWRGIWNFLDHYLFPDYFIFSNIISIFIGVAILYMQNYDFDELI